MLYVNVYHVSQLYGGPEEGGWYYDAGEPIASIPIETTTEKGKDFYVNGETTGFGSQKRVTKITIHTRKCDACHGTGEVEKEVEEYHLQEGEEPYTYKARCEDCRELPKDLEATAKLMLNMHEMFAELPGRYEHIEVILQDHFAAPYPDRKPHYE